MKKRFFYSGGATFVAVVAFMFASCSQEDDFIINNGLDIDSQVPMTRSEPGDGMIQQDSQPWRKQHMDESKENKCGTWALTEMLITEEKPIQGNSADDKFAKLDKYAYENFNGQTTNLTTSQMLQMGRAYGIVNESMDFMKPDGNGVMPSRNNFFNQHDGKVIVNYMKDGEEHWGYCYGVKKNGDLKVVFKEETETVSMGSIRSALYKK